MNRRISSPHALVYLSLGFFIFQAVINGIGLNGPHMDESIYFLGGLEIFKGKLDEGGFMVWFAGSPYAWPIISALSFKFLGGLFGARLVASAFMTMSLYFFGRFGRKLFNPATGFWSAAFLAVFGPFLHLAHFTVYDAGALFGVTLAMWLIAESVDQGNGILWIIFAGLAAAVGAWFKYPMLIMLAPLSLLVVYVFVNRGIVHASSLAIVFALAGIFSFAAYVAVFWNAGLNEWLEWATTHRNSFGQTRETMLINTLWMAAVPMMAIIVVPLLMKGKHAAYAILAGLTLLMWPVYHVVTLNGSADQKHIIFSVLLVYPLIGLGITQLVEKWRRIGPTIAGILLILVSSYGVAQMIRLDHSWLDTRPLGRYLAAVTDRGDKILIADAWSVLPYMIEADKLENRYDIADLWTVENITDFKPCEQTEWMVHNQGSYYNYPAGYVDGLKACGFEEVFRMHGYITPGANPWGGRYDETVVIYHRNIMQ